MACKRRFRNDELCAKIKIKKREKIKNLNWSDFNIKDI